MAPAAMREEVHFVRERGRGESGPAARLRSFARRHRPTWLIAAIGTILMAGVGAFDTGETAVWTLYSYWSLLIFAGCGLSAAAADWLAARGRLDDRPLHRAAGLTLTLTTAMTPAVWVLSALILGGSWQIARLPHLWWQTFLLATILVGLQLFVRRLDSVGAYRQRAPGTGRQLLERLPDRLHGAELHAIEAEDHYLRLHTDRGSALILMPLSEAVAKLEGVDGMRTHRSWWVARNAVVGATRGRGRALLTLRSGLRAPVSRTYAPGLRGAGWF